MSKKQNKKAIVKSDVNVINDVNVNRECTNRQAICKEVKKLKSDVRLDTCNVSKRVININSFSVNSQAQLIDLVLRSNKALTVNEIAKECLKHKDCSSVFKDDKCNFIDVLKRVKRHNNIDSLKRVIKRNSYLI